MVAKLSSKSRITDNGIYPHAWPLPSTIGTMSNDEATQSFLQEVFSQISEPLQADTLRLQDLWEQKLWHELTELLITIFNHPDSGPFRMAIYNKFVLQFADKINQLKLVDLALKAASQCQGAPAHDPRFILDYCVLTADRSPRTPRLC